MGTRALRVCIAHLRHAYAGGAERYLNYLATGLCERGHEVTVACRSHAQAPHPAVRFEVLRGLAFGTASRQWAFAKALERFVARHRGDFDIVFALGRTWSQDIIRLSGGCHQTWLDAMTATGGALRRSPGKDRLMLRLEARSLAPGAYRRVVCNSDMVRRDVMRRYAVPGDAVSVIHNGVDLDRFGRESNATAGESLRAAAGLSSQELVFLFLGTGFARKGLDLLLAAYARVAPRLPRTRLLIVGRDAHEAAFQRQARELGLADRVVFLGPRSDAEACLAAADVLVLPTRYDPFANVTVEALAGGLPVITTDANGGAEVLTPEVGTVVALDEDVIDNLSAALTKWADRDRLRAGAAAAQALAQNHGIERRLDDVQRLMLGLTEEKHL